LIKARHGIQVRRVKVPRAQAQYFHSYLLNGWMKLSFEK
jgi:hypothetical protein